MVLVDSSIWILAEGRKVSVWDFLRREDDIATCPVVMQEVLQGAGTARRYELVRKMLMRATVLDSPTPLERFEEAARLYLHCRNAGVTVRSSVDCLIAACAIANGLSIFHDDSDFDQIARVAPLKALRLTRS